MNETDHNEPELIVYSALVGDYDMVPAIPKERGVRRVLFSDRPRPDVAAFGVEVLPLEGDASNPVAARRLSRAPKIRPHLFLPPHAVSVWVDANTVFKRPCGSWAAGQLERLGCDVAAFRHPNPESKDVAGQARAVCHWGLDFRDVVESQLGRMARAGFPDDLTVTENRLLVRRDTPATRELADVWWREYCLGSLRDQMSFQFALWLCRVQCGIIEGHSRDNDLFRSVQHVGTNQIAPRCKLGSFAGEREEGHAERGLELREARQALRDVEKLISALEPRCRFQPEWLKHGGSNMIKRIRNITK